MLPVREAKVESCVAARADAQGSSAARRPATHTPPS